MKIFKKTNEKRKLKAFINKVKKSSYPIITVEEKCIEKYRQIRGNGQCSDLECIKKINRDYRCGSIINLNTKHFKVAYGCLYITYDVKQKKIVDIQNHSGYEGKICGHIDFKLKKYINKLYEIKEN